jgi:hypothetical protein
MTGMVPGINFAAGATFAHSTTDDFGMFTAQVTDNSLSNFTGPLLFDMMEHVTLIVPGLAAVVAFLIFYYGARVITNRRSSGVCSASCFWQGSGLSHSGGLASTSPRS